MAMTALEFLDMWEAAVLRAEEPDMASVDVLVAHCLELATEEEVCHVELTQQAGGDIRAYIVKVITEINPDAPQA